ncbi:MAG: FtsQ-type POTRA domain-containing protein [Actinobacteria bacterium]|nr:FtsQ-type POTRA domain-containing protein [Actinomycetota bacterium]
MADRDPDQPSGLRRVLSIVDDDGPDSVYLDGDLDPRGAKHRVVIVDDAGDGQPRVTRSAAESRLRARRIAVNRQAGRRRLRRLLVLVALLLVAVGVLASLGSSSFGVRESDVRVSGNVYTDQVALRAAIDSVVGTPVILVDTEALELTIEAIPWVDEATVRTDLPYGLVIDISEREPVLSYPGPDNLFRVLDGDGRVLDVIDGWPFEYLLLVGVEPPALSAGQFAPPGYVGAATLGRTLTGSILDRVALIQVDEAGNDLVVVLDDDTEIRFGAARDLFAKLVRLETVYASGAASTASVIDVSTDEVTIR